MAELEKGNPCHLKNLWSQPLPLTDAEFKQKLLEERAVYQRILNPTTQ